MAFSELDQQRRKLLIKSAVEATGAKIRAERGSVLQEDVNSKTMALLGTKSSFFDNFSGGFSFGKATWLPFAIIAAIVAIIGIGIGRALAGRRKRRR